MNMEDNKFPILVQRDSFPGMPAGLGEGHISETCKYGQFEQKSLSLITCNGLNPVIGKGYSGRDFSRLRPPLSTSSKTINSSGLGLSLYQLGKGASLDAGFVPYNGGSLGASAASNLGFGFHGPDGYGLPLGSNDANAQNLIGITARCNPETNRFANICLKYMQGDMFGLCKCSKLDQHGCCFLQRKLEEGDPAHQDMIFPEVYPHFG
ncbi:hypothetical protein BY996DRAFT_6413236 [Phakopsora pachyrhizi]|nr:hypothetical protein BY996DRAFT_6413236 [Phakopsora pachyrhizi]